MRGASNQLWRPRRVRNTGLIITLPLFSFLDYLILAYETHACRWWPVKRNGTNSTIINKPPRRRSFRKQDLCFLLGYLNAKSALRRYSSVCRELFGRISSRLCHNLATNVAVYLLTKKLIVLSRIVSYFHQRWVLSTYSFLWASLKHNATKICKWSLNIIITIIIEKKRLFKTFSFKKLRENFS